jgi:hypothetical protein
VTPEPEGAGWTRTLEALPKIGHEEVATRVGGHGVLRVDASPGLARGARVDMTRVADGSRDGIVEGAERVDETPHRLVKQRLLARAALANLVPNPCDRELREVRVREAVVGNAEAVVDLLKLIAPEVPELGVLVAPALLALAPMQARIEVERGAGPVTAQQAGQAHVGGHAVVPASHELHGDDRSPPVPGGFDPQQPLLRWETGHSEAERQRRFARSL